MRILLVWFQEFPALNENSTATASRVVNHGFSLSKDNPGDVEMVKRIVEGMKEGYGELLGEPISYFEDVNKLIGDLRTMLTKARVPPQAPGCEVLVLRVFRLTLFDFSPETRSP